MIRTFNKYKLSFHIFNFFFYLFLLLFLFSSSSLVGVNDHLIFSSSQKLLLLFFVCVLISKIGQLSVHVNEIEIFFHNLMEIKSVCV